MDKMGGGDWKAAAEAFDEGGAIKLSDSHVKFSFDFR